MSFLQETEEFLDVYIFSKKKLAFPFFEYCRNAKPRGDEKAFDSNKSLQPNLWFVFT
jgi:hypothetical protein